MAFRTVEISGPAEIHINKGQMEVTKEDGTFLIALEDIETLICSSAGIRMSTMAMSQIASSGISMMVINEKYHPSCISLPFESNVRQSLVLREQIALTEEEKYDIWTDVVRRKIENQAGALTLLGSEGSEAILKYTSGFDAETIDLFEAKAAKAYFQYLHPGLNRRLEDPVNSSLNYGYAVLRNAVIRAIVLSGFQPSIGLHHNNQFNSFNLADDLIEPWRPFVDVIAVKDPGSSLILGRKRRKALASVLYHACSINGVKMSVSNGIGEMVASIRRILVNKDDTKIKLPLLLPIEVLDPVNE